MRKKYFSRHKRRHCNFKGRKMNKIKCASVVTEKSYKEFLLLKFSIEMFHEVEWFLSTDSFTYRMLRGKAL